MEESRTRWLLEQRACSSRTEHEGLIGGVQVSRHGCCVLEIHEQSMGNECLMEEQYLWPQWYFGAPQENFSLLACHMFRNF